jgi:hypothetical protein
MNHFLKRIIKIILLPFLLTLIAVIFWDPFRVYFYYDDYYKNNLITGNREDVCLKLFERRVIKPTSFIVGNSRSQAFKTQYWANKICVDPSSCFHYDGSGMGIFRTAKALKFLNNNTTKIQNLLLVVDTDFFIETSNPDSHLLIQSPKVNEESEITYYWTFIRASLDPIFIFYNLINKITGKHFSFMGHHISKNKYSHISNNLTGDIWYSYDKEIKYDSVRYYNKLINENIFFERDATVKYSKKLIKKKQLALLFAIKQITDSNNTNVKIIISPLYNQLVFNRSDFEKLKKIFGDDSVYDFSGKNNFTSYFTNYYESSHYKTNVANEIMDFVY